MKSFLEVLNFVLCVYVFLTKSESLSDPPGHLQPLGSHMAPEGQISSVSVDNIPPPEVFFQNYVLPGKPLLFLGAAKQMPAYSLWTDEYLSSKFGSLQMDVEEGKKENRSLRTFSFKLKEFISKYKKKDIYMVESLPKPMREEYMLLKSLRCGGFLKSLQDAVMWFSSGGTKSVLHFDAVDNINCLFSGNKELFMVDKKWKHLAHIDITNGAYSSVDVDKVDMYKYTGLQKIPWFKAKMTKGDCLFIPYRWIHQVRSEGPRNLAVNIWWAHLTVFNTTDCETSPYKDKDLVPLAKFSFNPSEPTRQEVISKMQGKAAINLEQWLEIFRKQAEELEVDLPEIEITKNFKEVDKNNDGLVSVEELYQLKSYDIGRLLEVPAPSDEDEEGEPLEKPPKDGTNITPNETPSDQNETPSVQGETLGGTSDQGETPTPTDQATGSEKYSKRNEL